MAKWTSRVLTLAAVAAAYESALDEWSPTLRNLSDSIQGAYQNNRTLGDGQGLGFGDRLLSPPFNASERGWTAWNPVFSTVPPRERSPGIALVSLLENWDADFLPPDQKQNNRVRWVTVQDETGFVRSLVDVRSFRSIFFRKLVDRLLEQETKRQWSTERLRRRIPGGVKP